MDAAGTSALDDADAALAAAVARAARRLTLVKEKVCDRLEGLARLFDGLTSDLGAAPGRADVVPYAPPAPGPAPAPTPRPEVTRALDEAEVSHAEPAGELPPAEAADQEQVIDQSENRCGAEVVTGGYTAEQVIDRSEPDAPPLEDVPAIAAAVAASHRHEDDLERRQAAEMEAVTPRPRRKGRRKG